MVKVTKKRLSLLYVAAVMVMSPVSAQQQQRRMTVSELFELVENNSKSLLTQKTGAEVADQAVASAKSQRLPDINTSLSFSYIGNDLMFGGFALLAYPENYGVSGVMTFIVNQDGVVYEKNLGKDTGKLATKIADFDPDPTWNKIDEP